MAGREKYFYYDFLEGSGGRGRKFLAVKVQESAAFSSDSSRGPDPPLTLEGDPANLITTYIHTYIQTKNIMYTVAPKTIGQSRESGHILPISTRQLKSSLSDSVLCVFASICYLLCVCSNTTVDTYSSWMLPYKAL